MNTITCKYQYCNKHTHCLFRNAEMSIRNLIGKKMWVGTKQNCYVIACYEKDGFKMEDGYEVIPQNKSVVTKKQISKSGSPPKIKSKHFGESPIQTLPITIDNFFVSTYGVFEELTSIPNNFELFFNSKESKYYSNSEKTQIVRVSNHWGYRIRFCSWMLKGYREGSSFRWQKENGKQHRIGIISISDFKVNPAFRRGKSADGCKAVTPINTSANGA